MPIRTYDQLKPKPAPAGALRQIAMLQGTLSARAGATTGYMQIMRRGVGVSSPLGLIIGRCDAYTRKAIVEMNSAVSRLGVGDVRGALTYASDAWHALGNAGVVSMKMPAASASAQKLGRGLRDLSEKQAQIVQMLEWLNAR